MKLINSSIICLGLTLAYASGTFAQDWDKLGKELCSVANKEAKTVIVVMIGEDGVDRETVCGGKVRFDPELFEVPNDAAKIPLQLREIQWVLIGTNTCIWYKNSENKLQEICW